VRHLKTAWCDQVKILAFDTALQACSAALVESDGETTRCLAQVFERRERGHAEVLIALIDKLLQGADCRFREIDRIAVTTGPGTFTGVRIGVAAARGLALVMRCPVVGVTTLEAIAANVTGRSGVPPGGVIAVVVDARRNEHYCQLFAPDLTPLTSAAVLPLRDFTGRVPGGPVVVAGSGAVAAAAALGERATRMPASFDAPDAAVFARLSAGREPPPDGVAPFYLRPPDAKLPDKSQWPKRTG